MKKVLDMALFSLAIVGLCSVEGNSANDCNVPAAAPAAGHGEHHWHGADPTHFMTHLALHEAGEDGADASWGELVSDAEYGAAPSQERP